MHGNKFALLYARAYLRTQLRNDLNLTGPRDHIAIS